MFKKIRIFFIIPLIPWVKDVDGDSTFNLSGTDFGIMGNGADPYTDWIFWMKPTNTTPGEEGYREAEAQKRAPDLHTDQLYVFSLSDQKLRRITYMPGSCQDAKITANGEQIIFLFNSEDTKQIYSIRPDGTGLTQITHFTRNWWNISYTISPPSHW